MATASDRVSLITPGSRVVVRDEDWLVRSVHDTPADGRLVAVTGISELVQDTQATFFTGIDDIQPVRPEETVLVGDDSPGYRKSRLWMEAVLRKAPVPVSQTALTTGHQQLLTDLTYQRLPAYKALSAVRPRLLIADAVGLGKTLEIGIVLSELIRRGRAERILVVTPRQILEQFQHELWTRFSIGLVRLDSDGIQKVRQKIPPTRNPFTYFKRVIVSIDTLKQAGRYRHQLENVNWDVVVIDEVHNLINASSQRNTLARVLAPRTDALILASATPHNGKKESFAELVRLLDPAAIADPKDYTRQQVQHLYVQRFKKDVAGEVGSNFAERHAPVTIQVQASAAEEAVLADIADHWINKATSVCQDSLFPWTVLKAALSSPVALTNTMTRRMAELQKQAPTPLLEREISAVQRLLALTSHVDSTSASKLAALVAELRHIGVGAGSTMRAVVFSERVDTVDWLAQQLPTLLGLPATAVQALHAGLPEPMQQTIIEDFGQADRPVRVLVTSDMSSEGVNLHRQCHQLVHFDVPWSLIRVQQRNGRIDRYGQVHRPQIRALLLRSSQEAVSDEARVAQRLLDREHEAQLTLGDVSPILGKYSVTDEYKLIEKGLADGVAASELVPDDAHGFDLFAYLFDDTPSAEVVPVAQVPRLIADDWSFLQEALAEVVDDPRRQLDLEVDPARKFVAFNPPADLAARLDVLPEEVLRERNLKQRLKLTADRVEAEARLADAREHDRSQSMWPEVGWMGAHHPVFDWLVDKLLARYGRSEAPVIMARVSAPTFLVQMMHANRRGQSTIVEWAAIEAPGKATQRVRPMFDVLHDAGVGPTMANPGAVDPALLRELQGQVRAAVLAAKAQAKQVRDQQVLALDAKVADEQRRVHTWHQQALQLADNATQRNRVDRTHTDLMSYVESLRTEGDPFIRVVGVLVPSAGGTA